MQIVVMLEMAEQSKGLIKEATYGGEKKEKVQSIFSASDGFSTARLSSPVWRVAFYFYLGHFFPLVSSLSFFIHSTQNRSQGSTVLIHWLLLGGDALDQVSGLCSGLDQEEALGRVRVSPHHPPHPPLRAWNGWGSGMRPVSRGGRGLWRKVPHRVWL